MRAFLSVWVRTVVLVSKSKGRKPRKRKPSHPRVARTQFPASALAEAAAALAAPRSPNLRRLKGDEEALAAILDSEQITGDLLVALLLPRLWVNHADGIPGNLCVPATLALHHAFAQFDITAEVHAVDLVVEDERTGRNIMYGRPDPYWADDGFHGHCVLYLPESRRTIDPTVEQFPEVHREARTGPLVGRTAFTGGPTRECRDADASASLAPHAPLGVRRGSQMMLYTVVGEEYSNVVWESPTADQDAERYRRDGINLASHALTLLRLPDVVDRARQAPYPKLRALLDILDDAPIAADQHGDFYVTFGQQQLRLDEVPLPAEALAPAPAISALAPHFAYGEDDLKAMLADVETEARLYATTPDDLGGGPLPVAMFEPRQTVAGIDPHTNRAIELQVDGIIKCGFGRLLLGAAVQAPHLPLWSVRRKTHVLELWDAGGIWARANTTPNDDWLAAADRHGRVFVVYGPMCGVRSPNGLHYPERDRQDELDRARQAGIVAAATVTWRK